MKVKLDKTIAANYNGSQQVPLREVLKACIFNAPAQAGEQIKQFKDDLEGDSEEINVSIDQAAAFLSGARNNFTFGIVEQLEQIFEGE